MHDIIARAYAALAAIHPLAPWLALTLAIFAPQYAIRKWRPMWWERFALLGPEAQLASKVWQGLPSVLGGAIFTAYVSNGDPRAAFYGALAGALAPLKHELMKRSPLPYLGGSFPAASTAPRKAPTSPPLPLITFLVALGVAVSPSACGGAPEVVRAPSSAACDAGACERDAGADAGLAAPPDFSVRTPQTYGAITVALEAANGLQRAIICGGELTIIDNTIAPAVEDAGRRLLRLDRDGGR